jgi:hypothetical protein
MLCPFFHQFISIAEDLPRLVCVTTERCVGDHVGVANVGDHVGVANVEVL